MEAVEEEQEAVGAFEAAGMEASAVTEGDRLRRNQSLCGAARDKLATGVQRSRKLAAAAQ